MDKLISGATELGIKLTAHQLEQFRSYYQELIRWNERVNLTSITDYEEAQVKHFVDSLTVTLVLTQIPIGLKVVDIGSGAGLPGIPLKIAFNQISLVLIDTVAKKTAFLSHLVQHLRLEAVEVITARAEEIAHQPQCREQFHLVLSRAVAKLSTLTELTLPFCQLGGTVIAQKKGKIQAEIDQATKAISILGGKLREVKKVNLTSLPDQRYLVIIDKISPTPHNYPRRPGLPARHPI